MSTRKLAITAVLLTAFSAVLAACGGTSSTTSGNGASSSGTKRSIAAVLYSPEVPYYAQIGQGVKAQAAKYGWNLHLQYSQANAQDETTAVTNALTNHPAALILDPFDSHGLIPAAQQALAQHVPVVTLGDRLSQPSAQTVFVGNNFVTFGKAKAQYIVNQLHGHGVVGIIHGIKGVDYTDEQFTGAMSVFKKYPGITVIDGPYAGDYTAPAGLTATQNLLTGHPNLNAIFFDNDDLALGGGQAIKDRGIPSGKILLVSSDGLAAGLNGVSKGLINYTYAECSVSAGKEAVNVLYRMLVNHQKVPAFVALPTTAVTKQNVAKYAGKQSTC